MKNSKKLIEDILKNVPEKRLRSIFEKFNSIENEGPTIDEYCNEGNNNTIQSRRVSKGKR